MTATHDIFNRAMYAKLTGNANLAALVGTGVYDSIPDDSATIPYVVFQLSAGGDTNDTSRRNVDAVYRVECVSDKLAEARTGAGYIDDALHDQTLTMSGGWSNWRTQAEGLVSLSELDNGVLFWRRGAFYRVTADN